MDTDEEYGNWKGIWKQYLSWKTKIYTNMIIFESS